MGMAAPRIIALARHPSIDVTPVYSCGTVIDLDLTVKRRDPNAPIRIALDSQFLTMTETPSLSNPAMPNTTYIRL
jgi:hypothetical protein